MHHGCGCPLAVLAQEHFLKLAIPRARLHLEDFLLQLLTMACKSKPSRIGPEFVRHALLPLDKICLDPDASGWRDISPERVMELAQAFMRGEFAMSVMCDVQVMDMESTDNKKLVDDGLATCSALLQCQASNYANPDATPSGEAWPANIIEIIELGLKVKVVKYTDDGDKDARFRWNVAKHDVENNTVRWSTSFQKILVATSLYKKFGDWENVRSECMATYGSGKKSTYNRWIRAASGISVEVLNELKNYPKIPGGCIFDNNYLVLSPSAVRNKLTTDAAKKAFHIFAQYKQAEEKDMTTDTFVNIVCKGLRILEVCRVLSDASLVWVMRHNKNQQRIEPHGLVLLANSRIVVPGDGEIILK